MSVLVSRWIAGEAVDAPPIAPPNFNGARMPSHDPRELQDAQAEQPWVLVVDREPLAGRAFLIVYEDSEGDVSERRVVARQCFAKGERVYLRAICQERRALRLFRVDRIIELFCGVTGEDLGAAWAFFEPSSDDELPALGRKLQPYGDLCRVLGLLVTLARCDGTVHAFERRHLQGFIEQVLPEDESQATVDMLVDWAWRLAPSKCLFEDGLKLAFVDDPRWAVSILEAANEMVEADGKITAEELSWMDDLAWIAAQHGRA